MLLTRGVRRVTTVVAAATLVVSLAGTRALAQEPADPNPGAITLTANIDFLNRYMFRGIQQNNTGLVMWPSGDIGIAAYSGEGGLKSVGVNFGTWASLHTGNTGTDGPSGKLWYEGDFYTSLGLGFGGGVALTTTYTAYTSPNGLFSTVKEIMFKLAVDDSGALGKAAVKPYVAVAFELDTAPGSGQADGGANAGKYLELGIAPGYAGSKASIAVPVKVGLSIGDYYELAGTDNKFGYFSVAGIVTVPMGGTTKYGSWNVHFGGEYQALGDTTKAFNLNKDGEAKGSQFIGSVGIGFTY